MSARNKDRTSRFTMRLSPEDARMLVDLSDAKERSAADVVRRFILKEWLRMKERGELAVPIDAGSA